MAHHWGLLWWDLVEIILNYLTSTYLCLLVMVDLLVATLLLITADKQYPDAKQPHMLVAFFNSVSKNNKITGTLQYA